VLQAACHLIVKFSPVLPHFVLSLVSTSEGVDFDQIFSLVVRYETVRLICALAALEKWHMSALDMHNAYLYGELNEEIYMEQLEDYKAPGKEHKVLHLHKALYGLKQAGLTWWLSWNTAYTLYFIPFFLYFYLFY
jgi:hypothetical protein